MNFNGLAAKAINIYIMILPNIPKQSMHYELAGQELEWLPMDTQELFDKHLKDPGNPLLAEGWIDKKFSYKFNQHGFRSDEFVDEDSVLFLGCSHTMGIGIPWETTWPYIVSRNLKLKCYNLGIGGGSNDLAFRLAYNYIPFLKPKMVIFLVISNARLELLSQNETSINLTPGWVSSLKNDEFYKSWLMNDGNLNANLAKNYLAIEYICKMNSIKFISHEQTEIPCLDKARDLAHRGIRSNSEFANRVLQKI